MILPYLCGKTHSHFFPLMLLLFFVFLLLLFFSQEAGYTFSFHLVTLCSTTMADFIPVDSGIEHNF